MDEEQTRVVTQREASRAGLVVALFMVLMAGAAVFAVVSLWPLFAAVPVSAPAVTGQE
jgi:cell division septal protein FtsQ